MLQTCKHDTAKLIFQKVLIFQFNNFFFFIYKYLSCFCSFLHFWYSTIFTQGTLERTLCRSIFIVCRSILIVCRSIFIVCRSIFIVCRSILIVCRSIFIVYILKILLFANLGEPIPTPATFKWQVQKACPMWPQVKGALVK